MRDTWSAYWEGQRAPGHTSSTEAYYRQTGAELRALFPHGSPSSVLDLGCGNGALYEPLGFDVVDRYRGVDFSRSMLEEFSTRWPGVDVVHADASAYRDYATYDLVLSNGVVQYFDDRMFAAHLVNVRSMMRAGSAYICGGIPWRDRRRDFVSGRIFAPYRGSLARLARDRLRALTGRRDGIGNWYRLADVVAVASAAGLAARFEGAFQLYRFHAVFTPTGS